MTAHLEPGDIIHLAFPVSSVNGVANPKEIERMAADLIALYGHYGVTVAIWTGNTNLTCPTVVSVMRKPNT